MCAVLDLDGLGSLIRIPISGRKAIVERGVDVAIAVIDASRRSKSPAAICLERISADTRNDDLILATGDLSPTAESHKVAARQPDVRHLAAVAARNVVRQDVAAGSRPAFRDCLRSLLDRTRPDLLEAHRDPGARSAERRGGSKLGSTR